MQCDCTGFWPPPPLGAWLPWGWHRSLLSYKPLNSTTFTPQVNADSKFVNLRCRLLGHRRGIMMALEEKFDIQLDEEGAEKISTVEEAADLIAAQID